jgi:hypothetical protein
LESLKESLKKFDKLLQKYPDHPKHAYEFLSFFRSFTRMKIDNQILPIIELGAVLKHEKTNIFNNLKKLSHYNQAIDFITHVDMDYEEAIERLERLQKTFKS